MNSGAPSEIVVVDLPNSSPCRPSLLVVAINQAMLVLGLPFGEVQLGSNVAPLSLVFSSDGLGESVSLSGYVGVIAVVVDHGN